MDFKQRYQHRSADLLGRGGFARVYKATDMLLNRTVALKYYKKNENNKVSLIKEISRAVLLSHDNLCRYYDAAVIQHHNEFGEEEQIEVGVLEYINGGDLKTYLDQNPKYALKLFKDVLNGLDFLHHNRIIHRDLKAQNILVQETAEGPIAKITDFGISKFLEIEMSNSASELMGTIEYMAPEQFNPGDWGINGMITTNMDFWSFGVMVYKIMTGESLFGTADGIGGTQQVMIRILDDNYPKEKIERLVSPYRELLQRCIVKKSKERVSLARELTQIIEGFERNTSAQQPYVDNRTTEVINVKTFQEQKGKIKNLRTIEDNSIKKNTITEIKGIKRLLINARNKKSWIKFMLSIVLVIATLILIVSIQNNSDRKMKQNDILAVVDNKIKIERETGADSLIIKMAARKKSKAQENRNKVKEDVEPAADLVVENQIQHISPEKPKYTLVEAEFEGLIQVQDNNGKYGYIDNAGREVISLKYDEAERFYGGFARVKANGKWGYINKTGNEITPLKYDEVELFSEGLAKVKRNRQYGFIDNTGKEAITVMYDDARSFHEGLAAVLNSYGWGYIDQWGVRKIAFKYDEVEDFSGGNARVLRDGIYTIIDKRGKLDPHIYK